MQNFLVVPAARCHGARLGAMCTLYTEFILRALAGKVKRYLHRLVTRRRIFAHTIITPVPMRRIDRATLALYTVFKGAANDSHTHQNSGTSGLCRRGLQIPARRHQRRLAGARRAHHPGRDRGAIECLALARAASFAPVEEGWPGDRRPRTGPA